MYSMDISNIDLDSLDADWFMNHLADVRRIHNSEVISLTKNTMRFRGYFNYEPNTMPIERFLMISYRKNVETARVYETHFIKIVEMNKEDVPFRCSTCEKGEDCDPEENHIRLFPDEIITIRFEILETVTSNDQIDRIVNKIKNDEPAIVERDTHNRRLREAEEIREFNEYCKKYREENGKSVWDK